MKKLNEISNMPQMDETLNEWFYPVTLIKITETVVDYEVVQTPEYIRFNGVIQPLKPQEISLKPEEQRSWNWLQVHAPVYVKLKTGEKLLYNAIRYRVMALKDFSMNGFYEYHLVQDYEDT